MVKETKEVKMQNTKIDFVKVKKLAKVILTSSFELIGVFAIYLINLARAILNRTLNSFNSLINNPFTLSISLQDKNSKIILNKKASISSISKYLMMFGLIFVLVAAMFSVAINAADPGHGADVIGSGTFESGAYTFPLNLIINSNLRPGTGNVSGDLYVDNQTLVNTWLYNQSNYSSKELHGAYAIYWGNESGSYSPIKFGYNMSDNSQLLFNYNQTWNNESSKYLQINSSTATLLTNESSSYTPITWAYNQSDNSQLLFNYNQSDGNTNFTTDLINAYEYRWVNESGSYSPIKFGYNMSDNSQLLFNYNQTWNNESSKYLQINSSTASLLNNESGSYSPIKFGYNMSDGGADGNSDNLNNVAFVNNSNLFTSQNNFTFNLGASITAFNWSNVSIFRNQIRDNLANESGSYSPIKFGYNLSLATQNNFGEFWYNQSLASQNQFGKFWINQTASFTYTGTGDIVKETSPTIGGTWAGAVTFSGIHTHSVNITMNSNLTFNSKNNGVTFNAASRIYDNGSCLIIIGRTSVIEVC